MSALSHLEALPRARPARSVPTVEDARIARRRRTLQVALGLLWLLDAALQYQPFMFGRGFASTVIAPAAQGNPVLVARPELWAAHVIAANPVVCNSLFATVQLVLGLGLLRRRTVKLALAGSVAWSLGIWWFGEGLGGVLIGAGPIAGAPGPAILYALLALLLWPAGNDRDSVASSSLIRRASVPLWVVLWASEVYLALLPAGRSGSTLQDTIDGMAAGEPGGLAALGRWTARAAAHNGFAIALALGLTLGLVAVAVVLPARLSRPLLVLAVVAAALIWILGQSFGGIFAGRATDLNSGPLLVMLSLAYRPRREAPRTRNTLRLR